MWMWRVLSVGPAAALARRARRSARSVGSFGKEVGGGVTSIRLGISSAGYDGRLDWLRCCRGVCGRACVADGASASPCCARAPALVLRGPRTLGCAARFRLPPFPGRRTDDRLGLTRRAAGRSAIDRGGGRPGVTAWFLTSGRVLIRGGSGGCAVAVAVRDCPALIHARVFRRWRRRLAASAGGLRSRRGRSPPCWCWGGLVWRANKALLALAPGAHSSAVIRRAV